MCRTLKCTQDEAASAVGHPDHCNRGRWLWVLMEWLSTLSLPILSYIHAGLGAAEVDPPSGSVIANFEGTANATTLTCNVTNSQGSQTSTSWFVQNFRGSQSNLQSITNSFVPELFSVDGDPRPGFNITLRNRLTIVNLTSELDDVTVYCGTGQNPEQANFILRVYSKFV